MWTLNKYRKQFSIMDRWRVDMAFSNGQEETTHSVTFATDPSDATIQEEIERRLTKLNDSHTLEGLASASPVSLSMEASKEYLKWRAINFMMDNPTATLAQTLAVAATWYEQALLLRLIYEYGKQLNERNLAEIDLATDATCFEGLQIFLAAGTYEQAVQLLSGS